MLRAEVLPRPPSLATLPSKDKSGLHIALLDTDLEETGTISILGFAVHTREDASRDHHGKRGVLPIVPVSIK